MLAIKQSEKVFKSFTYGHSLLTKMATATFLEASQILGYRSRSTLYSLNRNGLLYDYLVNIQGRDHLYLKPTGKPRLEDYVLMVVQWRQGNVTTRN